MGIKSCAFGEKGFYEVWKLAIQTYGIKNPFSGRGAIAGLLPHGPNSVRDVLATHVLKRTGSYALAAYAIHDTPKTVMKYYCRFLPQEKLAQAAQFLNDVWEGTDHSQEDGLALIEKAQPHLHGDSTEGPHFMPHRRRSYPSQ
jgi:hypothetical protein